MGGKFCWCWSKGRSGILEVAGHTRDLLATPVTRPMSWITALFSLHHSKMKGPRFGLFPDGNFLCCHSLLTSSQFLLRLRFQDRHSSLDIDLPQGGFRDIINQGESVLFALFF